MTEWTEPVRIRPARVEDAKEIARIYNQGVQDRAATFDDAYVTPGERYLWLVARPEKFPVLIAEVKHTMMGWASLTPYSPRHCYDGVAELSIFIERSLRGHGVAQQLMKAMQEAARMKRVQLHILKATTESEIDAAMFPSRINAISRYGVTRT